jgi:membrane-bound lytic murein transglycosylase A
MNIQFSDLECWENDNHLEAYRVFQRSARQALLKPYKNGENERNFTNFKAVFKKTAGLELYTSHDARVFFEDHFTPIALLPEQGKKGLVTGFYEPIVKGSRNPTLQFQVPIYKQPSDLVEVTNLNSPKGWNKDIRFAQQNGHTLAPYPDRKTIENGYLQNQGLELVYVENQIEAFFIHVQGAARIILPDGEMLGLTYAAKSGHEFTAIGRILIDQGHISQRDISMQSIKSWLYAHLDLAQSLLWRNRSFIFFKESSIQNPELGPVAAAKVQLTAGRSIAVDRLKHMFGSAFYIIAPEVNLGDGKPFQRLMIAQDTGSAIIGTARGDLFMGSGFEAGEIAGKINTQADFYLLMPKVTDDKSWQK